MYYFYRLHMIKAQKDQEDRLYFNTLTSAIRRLMSQGEAHTYRHSRSVRAVGTETHIVRRAIDLTVEQALEFEAAMRRSKADSNLDVLDFDGKLIAVITGLPLQNPTTGRIRCFF